MGCHRARIDDDGANPVRLAFGVKRLSKPGKAEFSGAVGGGVGPTTFARHRRDVDNSAVPLRLHSRKNRLGEQKRRA